MVVSVYNNNNNKGTKHVYVSLSVRLENNIRDIF